MRHHGMGVAALGIMVCVWAGCASMEEVGKTIWGSSIRELDKRRPESLTRTYNTGYWDCDQAVLKAIEEEKYTIFQKDEVKGYIVIMGIPGYVNTTEVGIFLVELSDHQTRIELTSLSTNAKRAAAKALFKDLDKVLTATTSP